MPDQPMTDHDMIRDIYHDVKMIMRGEAPFCMRHSNEITAVKTTLTAHVQADADADKASAEQKQWTWRSLAGPIMQWAAVGIVVVMVWAIGQKLSPPVDNTQVIREEVRAEIRDSLRDIIRYQTLNAQPPQEGAEPIPQKGHKP